GRSVICDDLTLGDSVAVDGVCLTVEQIFPQGFIVDVSPETLRRTTLEHQLRHQIPVNLETSLRVGSKLGGHFVTGHVDGIGYLQASIQTATSWEMTFSVAEASLSRYLVSKGSIAVNGISLTVAQCDSGTDRFANRQHFTVAVIPHTYRETNLHYLEPGSKVNLEGDILGKYVERFLEFTPPGTPVSANFLVEHGYL
ncbi:MAG: riboflavin synthase, partial [Desertifilum sp. SIO1I2]|nr:riboflavin synthase [Desertifilum sp. SIO1I2]